MPSTRPLANPTGFSMALPFQTMREIGVPDPTFYAAFSEDFMNYSSTPYTITATGNGAVARVAGKGGLATFTTNSTTPAGTDILSMQSSVATLGLTLGYKFAFTCSLTGADLINPAFVLGCIQATSTPFTVTDGIWISKASTATTIAINHAIGSVVTTAVVPAAAFTVANNATLNLGFFLSYKGEIEVYATGAQGGVVTDQDRVALGPLARIVPASLTTANLTPTVAVQSGTATSKVVTVDWFQAFMERQTLV